MFSVRDNAKLREKNKFSQQNVESQIFHFGVKQTCFVFRFPKLLEPLKHVDSFFKIKIFFLNGKIHFILIRLEQNNYSDENESSI